jgi:hypothetical protein
MRGRETLHFRLRRGATPSEGMVTRVWCGGAVTWYWRWCTGSRVPTPLLLRQSGDHYRPLLPAQSSVSGDGEPVSCHTGDYFVGVRLPHRSGQESAVRPSTR